MWYKEGKITRRGFLTKTTAGIAIAASAPALISCSKNDNNEYFLTTDSDSGFEPVKETVYPGAAFHNCKGRCSLKAHVRNGVIKRFSTDESPDTDLNPQLRSCLRCRSYRMKIYGPGRLLYPLIYSPDEPNAERGDMSKFKRVTWEEAMAYIKTKYDGIKAANGNNMHTLLTQGTALYGIYQNKNMFMRVVNQAMGGSTTFWGQASFNAGTYIFNTVAGTTHANLRFNPESAANAKTIIFWGSNLVNSTGSTNVAYEFIKAREKGAKILYIGPVYNKTAELADEFIPLKPGTDTALLLAMIHEMLNKNYLDEDLISKYAVGFFDNIGSTNPPQLTGKASTEVPAGQSLSAYIYGKSRKHPRNGAVCTRTITENSTKYSYKADFLAEKTPEWAERITGISAAKIRELAKLYAVDGKPCAIRSSIGLQRQPNGVQNCWLLMTLCLITGNFGKMGTGLTMHYYGVSANPVAGLPSNGVSAGTNPETRKSLCHLSLLMDAIRAKGNPSANSRWKFDAELMSVNKPVKIIISYAGNSLINQQADPFSAIEQLKDRRNVELIINVDNVMTPSARWSDVILPGDAHFERTDIVAEQNYMLYMPKVIEPMGEIKGNDEIACELGKAFGLTKSDIIPDNKTYSERIEEAWYNSDRTISFAEFKQTGVYRVKTNEQVVESTSARTYGMIDDTNKLGTATGYWEIYSNAAVKRYETRNEIGLPTPLTQTNEDFDGDREVIEIPTWMDFDSYHYGLYSGTYGGLPAIADASAEFPFKCLAQHSLWRAHSNHSGISYLRELYKQDGKGNPAYDHNTYSVANWQQPGATKVFPSGYGQPSGYEPLWINPNDATQFVDGQLVKVTSAGTRQAIIAVIYKTLRCMPGTLVLEQGSWFDPVQLKDGSWVDRGGCSSTLITEMPTIGDRGPSMMISAVKLEAFDESQYK